VPKDQFDSPPGMGYRESGEDPLKRPQLPPTVYVPPRSTPGPRIGRWRIAAAVGVLTATAGLIATATIRVSDDGDQYTYRTSRSIPVGTDPFGIGLRAEAHRLYVANSQDNSMTIIDTSSQSVLKTVAVGHTPNAVGVSANSGVVYVPNWKDNTVSVLDGGGNPIDLVEVDRAPYGIAVDDARARVFVTNSGSNSVSVIDAHTNSVTTAIGVGGTPNTIALDEINRRAYVANCAGSISVINVDTLHVEMTFPTSENTCEAAIDPKSALLHTANYETGEVTTYAAATGTRVRGAAYGNSTSDPIQLTINTASNALIISVGSKLIIIDSPTGEIRSETMIGDGAFGSPTVDQELHRIYLPNGKSNSVMVLDRE